MTEMLYADAIVAGLREAMAGDENVHISGQYFVGLTEHRSKMVDLREDFPDRFYFPPIAEVGYAGAAIGAAMVGLRPIVDLATASFMFQAFPQLLNEAANIHYMSGGRTKVPMVFHFNAGIRGRGASQHSHSPQAMLWNTPGLQIMLPSSPADVLGLLRTAVASDNPVAWVDHVRLFDTVGPAPVNDDPIPFGLADVKRAGSDVTIVASSFMTVRSLSAAAKLADEGIDVEVVDLRSLVPLDERTIVESVAKTRRVVVVDECHRRSGVGSEIVAVIAENLLGELAAPIRRVVTEDVPIPFSTPMEEFVEPTEAKIIDAVRAAVA